MSFNFNKKYPHIGYFIIFFVIFSIFLFLTIGVLQMLLITEPVRLLETSPVVLLISFWWALCGALTIKYWDRKRKKETSSKPTA